MHYDHETDCEITLTVRCRANSFGDTLEDFAVFLIGKDGREVDITDALPKSELEDLEKNMDSELRENAAILRAEQIDAEALAYP